MEAVALAHPVDFAGWRTHTRRLVLAGVPPEEVIWSVGAPDDLFATGEPPAQPLPAGTFSVERALVDLAATVIQARDPERFALLYRLVWRANRGEKQLAAQVTDPDVHRATRLAQSVRRDTHKMRAFLRFRAITPEARGAGTGGPEARLATADGPEAGAAITDAPDRDTRYVAWFEPEHFILEANAGFFTRRFATMVFSILTPYRSFHWNGVAEEFGPGANRADIPDDDALAEYWRTYFSAIFNPARIKLDAMRSEMPKKYWRNLPEAAAIPELVRAAEGRVAAMIAKEATPVPVRAKAAQAAPPPAAAMSDDLPGLAHAAAECRRCALWSHATQVVFGEGPADARMMMVGEQPGDQEDLAGRPFVGPAGQLLDRAIAEAGIDRREVYVTNAVKHFKFEPRGKRRIHQKPDLSEITACSVWIEAERRAVAPAVTVLLGATAARAVLGRTVTIGRERGRAIAHAGNTQLLITVHPSYLLRLPDEDAKRREYAAFVADLRMAQALLQ